MDGSGTYRLPDLAQGSAWQVGGATVATIAPSQLRLLTQQLRTDGHAGSTPLLVLVDAGHPGQRSFESTLAEPVLPAFAACEDRVVVVIGDLVSVQRRLAVPTEAMAAADAGTGFSMIGIAG